MCKIVNHVTVEMLEKYAMRDLSNYEAEKVEKHVLSCPECQDRLEAEIGWTAALRSAAKHVRRMQGRPSR